MEAGFKTRLIENDKVIDVRDGWQDFFQEDPETLPDLQEHLIPEVRPPYVLVATANLCALGSNLHKTHHLVKFDVDFEDGGDCRALKRTDRVG